MTTVTTRSTPPPRSTAHSGSARRSSPRSWRTRAGGRRALAQADAAVVVATGAVAAFAPLAVEQALLTDPRPDSWPQAAAAGLVAWVAFGLAARWRLSIRRASGSLYYISALARPKVDRVATSVSEQIAPSFLASHRLVRDLPEDPRQWRAPVDQIVDQLRAIYEADDRTTPDALFPICEWPVAWYLGARLTHHWQVDIYQPEHHEHHDVARKAISIPLAPATGGEPAEVAPDAPGLHAVLDGPTGEPSAGTVVISLEVTRTLAPDARFLGAVGTHRFARIHLAEAADPSKPVYGRTLEPDDMSRLVGQVAARVVEVMTTAERVVVIAAIPGSWPYALGVAVNYQAETQVQTDFAVWDQATTSFALTDLTLRAPAPTRLTEATLPAEATVVNLTPHPIVIDLGDRQVTFPPAGIHARRALLRTPRGTVKVGDDAIDVVASTLGEIEDLPAPMPGTLYVTSRIVAEAARRPDVLFPDREVRDQAGRVIACQGLGSVG